MFCISKLIIAAIFLLQFACNSDSNSRSSLRTSKNEDLIPQVHGSLQQASTEPWVDPLKKGLTAQTQDSDLKASTEPWVDSAEPSEQKTSSKNLKLSVANSFTENEEEASVSQDQNSDQKASQELKENSSAASELSLAELTDENNNEEEGQTNTTSPNNTEPFVTESSAENNEDNDESQTDVTQDQSPDQQTSSESQVDSLTTSLQNDPLRAKAEALIKSRVAKGMETYRFPGAAIAYDIKGKTGVVYFGLAKVGDRAKEVTAETIFEIGSVTKSFTALLLARALKESPIKPQLEDTVIKYVQLPIPAGQIRPISSVTLYQLASHTSGLPKGVDGVQGASNINTFTPANLMEYFANWTPEAQNGNSYHYSNIGIGLLGYALANMYPSPMSFAQQLKKYIFLPLHMENSFLPEIWPISRPASYAQGYILNDDKQLTPAPMHALSAWPAGGAIRSTGPDMGNYLSALLGHTEVLATYGSLSEELERFQRSARETFNYFEKGVVTNNPKLPQQISLVWGRYDIKGTKVISKPGSTAGFSANVIFSLEKDLGVAVLTNLYGAWVETFSNELMGDLITEF